ncbi:hypothetical protein [Pseudomonas chlororaphis]|uniref:hypothetical protein n=1 Tax=Pseudomonas chlororaphis TaxID=587753 RepID=UPI000F783B2F|nr:hypothetical protein [Pseudomonas chlororaphis]MBM0283432.1 hypothetical protein [Pseudomonas chlororaphis]MDO1503758.1 hypothetical protein [Pseudomonas chlororaphis]TWR95080.1 hypothetical protein FJD36_18735 [Pseudomonas chlororaphis subsp. chlororaphis]WDG99066.1 hypothetical protein PUP54_05725 [Pseudomonas chlororaphis]WDH18073.1 hypothetical protein PUP70_08225 [Pseudomonas chlororaphis]
MELIRKISLAKWKNSLAVGPEYISADAVTGCLRTSENTLSVWKNESEVEYDQSVLALLASLTSMETIDIVRLGVEELEQKNLELAETEGDTRAKGLENLHRDIINLDHAALKSVAEIVKAKVAENKSIRFRKPDIKVILNKAVAEGVIDIDLLPDKVRAELLKK